MQRYRLYFKKQEFFILLTITPAICEQVRGPLALSPSLSFSEREDVAKKRSLLRWVSKPIALGIEAYCVGHRSQLHFCIVKHPVSTHLTEEPILRGTLCLFTRNKGCSFHLFALCFGLIFCKKSISTILNSRFTFSLPGVL